jgi:tetratricopeptide (TPR) repeat protein
MRWVRLGALLLTLTAAFSAAAEDKDAARKAFSEATRYYNLNQYAEALEAFKRVLQHHPLLPALS